MGFFESIPSCIYNKMVDCPESMRTCAKCGWNPEVEKQRTLQFAAEHPELVDELIYMGRLNKEEGDQK